MTINSTIRKAGPFIGNGTAFSFPFTYKVFQASDLDVVRLDQSTNVETTLVLTTQYTVTLNQDQDSNPGGTVTLVGGPLATGYTLTMTSDVPNLQPTDLTNQGGFYPEVINDSLDRATIQIQQLQEQADRTLRLPLSSTADAELPPPSPNDLIGWDATGNNLINVDAGTLATVVAYATAYCDVFVGNGITTSWTLTRNPAVLYNLDVSINGSTQEPTRDYTLSGTTFTMTTPPPIGARVVVKYKEGLPNYSGDSQDVRFVPGRTGSVTRSVQSKLRDSVSVLDFIPEQHHTDIRNLTSTYDAGPAFNYAISTGKNVFVPAGKYRISTPINIANRAAGSFKLYGEGWGIANSGSVLEGNTGGVCIDCTGSQWISIEDLAVDSTYPPPPNPSTVGILFARSAGVSEYAQFNTLRNVYVNLPSNMSALGGNGTVAIYNNAAEIHHYDNVYALADTGLFIGGYNNFGVVSPYATIGGPVSMSMISITGASTFHGKSTTRYAVQIMNAFGIKFYNTYIAGTSKAAYLVAGCTNVSIDSHIENSGYVADVDYANMLDIKWTGGTTSESPIKMPSTFSSLFNVTIDNAGSHAGWSYVIESGLATSVINNVVCRMNGDDGTTPLTNVINTVGVQRIIRTGLQTGGFDSLHIAGLATVEKNLRFNSIAASSAANGTLFFDSGTNKLTFKDFFGGLHALY